MAAKTHAYKTTYIISAYANEKIISGMYPILFFYSVKNLERIQSDHKVSKAKTRSDRDFNLVRLSKRRLGT